MWLSVSVKASEWVLRSIPIAGILMALYGVFWVTSISYRTDPKTVEDIQAWVKDSISLELSKDQATDLLHLQQLILPTGTVIRMARTTDDSYSLFEVSV